jgi:beta-glucosidase
MLKHKFIIERLSEAQKIKILTDVRCLESDEYARLGVPTFKLSYVEGYKRELYPSPASLANSWNKKVISEVASDIAVGMSVDGASTVVVPSPVAKLNLNDIATTEDPYLSSKLTEEYLLAIGKTGMGVVVDGAYFDANDVSRLDKTVDERLINEFVIRPFKKATENKKCNGFAVSSDIDVRNYETVNTEISDKVSEAVAGSYVLCKNIIPEDTVARIVKGHICLDGSELVLKAATDRYKRLKNEISKGKVSACELDAEIENGSAFPPEKIDEAVDRVLEFAFDCAKDYKGKLSSYTPSATVVKNASYESTVLLKNKNGILPLKTGTVVGLVGDIIVNYNGEETDNSDKANDLAYYMRNQGCVASGFLRGYSMCEDRSESLLPELAMSLASVDTVFLFMGTNPKREAQMIKTQNLYLPANQLAALEAIHKAGKKIVAVVSSNLSFDTTFDSLVDALLVAPLNTKYGAEAAIDIIMGKAQAIGRLANTLYRNTELIDKKQSYYLDLPSARVGTFLGYRYYDTAGFDVAYPFGFGVSNAKFKYSNISVQANSVVFTVKNKGKSVATEVVQLYVGLKKSNRLSPKKELVGFEKITLQPDSTMTLSISLDNLERFDSVRGEWAFEEGEYILYIGTSVSDIKLTHKIILGNATLENVNERASDYLQSVTNIISDRFTLEADYKLMKRNARNIIFGIGSLLLSIAMFVFSPMAGSVGIFFTVVAAILAVAGVVFFILEGLDRGKLHKSEREMINEANKEQFKDSQNISEFSAAQVFADEFDKMGSAAKKAQTPVQAKGENYLEYVNQDLTFKDASEQFIAFAASRGYKLDESSAREIFAAMSSSRLIITKGMTNDAFASALRVISEYFGTTVGVDVVDHTYVNENSALYKTFGGEKRKTALANVIERSSEEKSKVHIAALSDVTFTQISEYFVPFARYIRNPRNATVIDAIDENGENVKFKPSENLWFFLNLRMGESLKNIPSYISELASVIKIDYSGAVPTRTMISVAPFNYYQFDYMLDKIKATNGISEGVWKKVDSFTDFVRSSTPYLLNNRVCISIEKFYAVFSACGGNEGEALDRALSARVIPSAVVALNGVENTEAKNLSEKLEMIFGEENIEVSRSAIRASGTTVL